MGQYFPKPTSGGEVDKRKQDIFKDYYEKHLKNKQIDNKSEFYRAICDTVEELNGEHGYTQVKAREEKLLKETYDEIHRGGGQLSETEFVNIMEDVMKKSQVTGFGSKDTLLYIFGIPASATFIKNALMPGLVSNEVLIPSMTSLTALVLAKLNKI